MEAEISAGSCLLDDDLLMESMENGGLVGNKDGFLSCADDLDLDPGSGAADAGADDLMGLESDGLFAGFNKPPMFYEDDEDFQSSSKSSPQTSDEAQSDASLPAAAAATAASTTSIGGKRKRSIQLFSSSIGLPVGHQAPNTNMMVSAEEIISSKRTRKPSVKIIEAAESA